MRATTSGTRKKAISIHSLVKRETKRAFPSGLAAWDFNPLPRKEGDRHSGQRRRGGLISIHSLVKRETAIECPSILHFQISIHSLVKRETQIFHDNLWKQRISIHSLVKRETAAVRRETGIYTDFNPLPRKEGDGQR